MPKRSTVPTLPSGALVNELPIAPPITESPLRWWTRIGYLSKSWAMLVSVPVATSHDVCKGVARSAAAMASIAAVDVIAGTEGGGRSEVPSNPDSPILL